MGLFGGLARRLKDGRIADGLAAAQATLSGDAASALRVQEAGRERRQQAHRDSKLREAIRDDPNLDPQLRTIFDDNPSLYPQYLIQRVLAGQGKTPAATVAEARFPPPFMPEIEGYPGPWVPRSKLPSAGYGDI